MPRISEAARHVVIPHDIATTGWPPVARRIAEMGVDLDEWQTGAGKIILAKDHDGHYAATVGGIVISIPRQVGKTFLIAVIILALCSLNPGLTVVWTAHHGTTTGKTFETLRNLSRRRHFARHLAWPNPFRTSHGEEELRFANGARIMFGARGQGLGRGFDAVDVIVFDEAQILTERTMNDMVAATNQSRHPAGALLIFTGTPPQPHDPSEVFTSKRDALLTGKDAQGVYIEFSADVDAEPDDVEQWKVANPSYPERTSHKSMLRLRANLGSEESWKREALGIWDAKASPRVIPAGPWSDLADAMSKISPNSAIAFAVDRDPGETTTALAIAGWRADGTPHVEVIKHISGDPGWVIPWLEERCINRGRDVRAVVIDVASPAKALTQERRGHRWVLAGEKDITVTAPTVDQVADACSQFLRAVHAGQLHHINQPGLNHAVDVARKRTIRSGSRWLWDRVSRDSDITALVAVTNALWGLTSPSVKRPYRAGGRAVSRGSTRR